MMKKLISFALTLAMVMALTVPAFAAAIDPFVGDRYTASNECVGTSEHWGDTVYQYPLGTVLSPANQYCWYDDMMTNEEDITIDSTNVQTLYIFNKNTYDTYAVYIQGVATDGTPATPSTPTEPEKPATTVPTQYVQPIMDYRYDEAADDSVLTEVGNVSFGTATTEEKTVSIAAPWNDYEDTITIIRVQPGTLMTVSGEDIKASSFCILDGTKLEIPVSSMEYLKTDEFDGTLTTGVVDRVFAQFAKPACLVLTPNGAEKMVILALDGSATPTEPTQPAEPEKPIEPETPTQPSKPTTPVIPDAPGTYTVKKGDTWSSICTNFYGTNAQRYALQKANKGVALKEGAVITLPEKLGKDTLIPAPAAAAGEKLYTVKAGDTLGRIAAAEYGKVSEYKAIFERNADRLKNANLIYEGQVIVLPAKK